MTLIRAFELYRTGRLAAANRTGDARSELAQPRCRLALPQGEQLFWNSAPVLSSGAANDYNQRTDAP